MAESAQPCCKEHPGGGGGGDKQNPNKPQPDDGNTRVQRGREALAVGFPVLSMGVLLLTPIPLPFMTQREETYSCHLQALEAVTKTHQVQGEGTESLSFDRGSSKEFVGILSKDHNYQKAESRSAVMEEAGGLWTSEGNPRVISELPGGAGRTKRTSNRESGGP